MSDTNPTAVRDDDRAVVTLAGELDFTASRHLFTIDLDHLAATGCRSLLIDMERVAFIDSSGIGALIHVRNAVVSRGLRFEIANLSVPVERTLIMAGLAELFALNAHA